MLYLDGAQATNRRHCGGAILQRWTSKSALNQHEITFHVGFLKTEH